MRDRKSGRGRRVDTIGYFAANVDTKTLYLGVHKRRANKTRAYLHKVSSTPLTNLTISPYSSRPYSRAKACRF